MGYLRTTIWKEYAFDSAHHLDKLPPEHKCSGVHGHTYTVRVAVSSVWLDEVGFVVDYAVLDGWMKPLIQAVDHKDLNAVFRFNPTAENLCRMFWENVDRAIRADGGATNDGEELVRIEWVEVQETNKTGARIERGA